jgi:hypothetical protein
MRDVATIVLMSACSYPFLTPVLIAIICVRRERFQLMEIPHKRDIVI